MSTQDEGPFEPIFLAKMNSLLETNVEEIDDSEVRLFMAKIPKTFIVSKDHYDLMIKLLFKLKNVSRKEVLHDTLAMLKLLFSTVDYNVFLLQFWNNDEFKEKELGPIGYSFTNNQPKFDYSSIKSINNSIVTVNEKATETAWSMVLDLKATLDAMINTYLTNKALSVFHLIILRRFSCLGNYTIKIDGKDTPIILHFFRKMVADIPDGDLNRAKIVGSFLVSISWASKGHYCWSCIKPKYVLIELMQLCLQEDSLHEAWLLSIKRLFYPMENFVCEIEWDADSTDFDNPTLFLINFTKYFNRKQKMSVNHMIFETVEAFKSSTKRQAVRLASVAGVEETICVDWPFHYHVIEKLGVIGFKHPLPSVIYNILPEEFQNKYVKIEGGTQNMETALVNIFELALVGGLNFAVPEIFYKSLWSTYKAESSIIEAVAEAIITAYDNLNSCFEISIEARLMGFISRLCHCAVNVSLYEQMGFVSEINFELVSKSYNIIIAGRVVRRILEKKYEASNKRRPAFEEAGYLARQLFDLFVVETKRKFTDFRVSGQGLWAPWRKGVAPCNTDSKCMAINYILSMIQKEAFCIFDTIYGIYPPLYEFIDYLHRQKNYYGIVYPKMDAAVERFMEKHQQGGPDGDHHDNNPRPQYRQQNEGNQRDNTRSHYRQNN